MFSKLKQWIFLNMFEKEEYRRKARAGYSFTAQAAVGIMTRILSPTIKLAYGSDFVIQFDAYGKTN